MDNTFDVIIVGAGPSGSACAIRLKDSKLKIALIDKDIFPREKTCGDGMTLDVVNQLPLIAEDLKSIFDKLTEKMPSYGVKVCSINRKSVGIPVVQNKGSKSMFTVKRIDFDNMLLLYVKNNTPTPVFENCQVSKITRNSELIELHTSSGLFKCSMIVGADGAGSSVAKYLRPFKISEPDKIIALRQYFENVNFEKKNNFLEFYYIKKILPGGIWVFPEQNNIANVGLGMQISVLKKKKINLQKVLEDEIANGVLKEMFLHAKPVSKLKGHIIPVGKTNRIISGERYILTGDAAGLANAFTGEGIGNALRSGRVAADHIINCFEKQCFSSKFNKNYDKEIYKRMGKEFNNYRLLQLLCSSPFISKFLINRMAKLFTDVYGNPEYLKKAHSKSFFIFRLLKSFFNIKSNNVISE